jgi:hypothetical protein
MLDISDFKEWLKNPFTEELKTIFAIEKSNATNCILYKNGMDAFEDKTLHEIIYHKGCLHAYEEFLNVDYRGDELLLRINERLKDEKR